MFHRRPKAVVPMDAEYLARNDGSIESSGRGSGLESAKVAYKAPDRMFPYGTMTFAPLERRLDSAIFRSLFASSARQARQFVVHGAVKVNGKKVSRSSLCACSVIDDLQMRYPGYLLNPGDMFQVDPERVMFATGQPKPPLEAVEEVKEEPEEKDPEVEDADVQVEAVEKKAAQAEHDVDIDRNPRDLLKELLRQSRAILVSPKEGLAAKRKQELRAFSAAVKKMLSRSKSSTILTDSLEAQFMELQNQLKIRKRDNKSSLPSEQKVPSSAAETSEGTQTAATPGDAQESTDAAAATEVEAHTTESYTTAISENDYDDLQAALLTMAENPVDDRKPYATPWMPRDYMSAFAFIPRYLEVHQSICAGVYLRHPVVRPGMGEVPSPFGEDTSSVAHTWYLRRR
jgi:ribosomal protein S4